MMRSKATGVEYQWLVHYIKVSPDPSKPINGIDLPTSLNGESYDHRR